MSVLKSLIILPVTLLSKWLKVDKIIQQRFYRSLIPFFFLNKIYFLLQIYGARG